MENFLFSSIIAWSYHCGFWNDNNSKYPLVWNFMFLHIVKIPRIESSKNERFDSRHILWKIHKFKDQWSIRVHFIKVCFSYELSNFVKHLSDRENLPFAALNHWIMGKESLNWTYFCLYDARRCTLWTVDHLKWLTRRNS